MSNLAQSGVYCESGVQVNLADKPHFRFQDLKVYRQLSGRHVQEMDFCWLADDRLILLELKAYKDEVEQAKEEHIPPDQFVDHLVAKTAPKIWDALLMFSACWLPTKKGEEFRKELSPVFHKRIARMGVVIVLDVPPWFIPHFNTLKRRFRTVLVGKLALFDCQSLLVCMPDELGNTRLAATLQPVGSGFLTGP